MGKYKVDISGIDTNNLVSLSSEEMMNLFKSMSNGNLEVRELLINGNLKLVLSVLKKFYNKQENLDDLFQIGCVGLLKAIDNFDLSYGVKFSTYSVLMIEGEIRKYLRDNNTIRVSRSVKENAYKILSEDCKKELYPTLEKFQDNYVKIIFESFKMHEMQLWKVDKDRYIYSVRLEEDILATGNTQSGYIQEYYTIVQEDNKKKLNINGFIDRETINKTKVQENIKFKVLDKNIYNEYEEYIVEVQNLTSNSICIDTKKSTKTILINTSKGFAYYASLYEIPNESLILKEQETNTYNIKFQKGYREDETTETISFSNLVLNYNLNNEKNIKVTIEL